MVCGEASCWVSVQALGVEGAWSLAEVARGLPFGDAALDHVIEHCPDPVVVLREWRRTMRTG